ncbi:myb/SANT-like DNA-binding domain-containing protein 7 [Anolis sagrei]|uniref:myb/SANT-like DNA-binding domain-containing protein 7 n=1 Tax=Anolis sagrei TaxID=38937 RepID=UPI0035225CB8
MEQKARASQMKGKGKGTHWRYREIQDLLVIWGEKKVQDALKAVHKNLDVFEGIAEQMRERGHSRTAEECRNKTKAMRFEYKRVQAHNECSGNTPKTCAFYTELENILKGDASTDFPRLSRSWPVRREERPLSQNLDATILEETCSRESVLDKQATGPSLITVEGTEDNEEDSLLLLLEEANGKVLEPVNVHVPPALVGSPSVTPITTEAEDEGEPETPNQSQQSLKQEREDPLAKAGLSPGTRGRTQRTRRRGRRGENIAMAIMQNANEQARLQREAMREDTSQDRQILLSFFHYFEEESRASQQRFDAIEKLIRDVLERPRAEKPCCTHCTTCCNAAAVQEQQDPEARPRIPPLSQTDLDMASTSAAHHVQPLPDSFGRVSQGETLPISNPVSAYIMELAHSSSQLAEAQRELSEDTEGTRKSERERKRKKPYSP